MPCYDHRDSPEYQVAEARQNFRHNSDVAEMLCYVLSNINPVHIATMPENIQVWWKEHQERDALKQKG